MNGTITYERTATQIELQVSLAVTGWRSRPSHQRGAVNYTMHCQVHLQPRRFRGADVRAAGRLAQAGPAASGMHGRPDLATLHADRAGDPSASASAPAPEAWVSQSTHCVIANRSPSLGFLSSLAHSRISTSTGFYIFAFCR